MMFEINRANREFFGLFAAASRVPAPLFIADRFVKESAVRFGIAAILGGFVTAVLAVSILARHPLRLAETQPSRIVRQPEDYRQNFRVLVSFPHPDADSPPELQLLDMATAQTALSHRGTLVIDPLYDSEVLLSSTVQGLPAEVLCDISESHSPQAHPQQTRPSDATSSAPAVPPDQPRRVDIQFFDPAHGQTRCIYAANAKAFTPLDFNHCPDRSLNQVHADQSVVLLVSGLSAVGLFAFGARLLAERKATTPY